MEVVVRYKLSKYVNKLRKGLHVFRACRPGHVDNRSSEAFRRRESTTVHGESKGMDDTNPKCCVVDVQLHIALIGNFQELFESTLTLAEYS